MADPRGPWESGNQSQYPGENPTKQLRNGAPVILNEDARQRLGIQNPKEKFTVTFGAFHDGVYSYKVTDTAGQEHSITHNDIGLDPEGAPDPKHLGE